jgi:molybdopterin-guanine dinucleotide biosynthesis protein A
MGEQAKALANLGGLPLIQHVINRLRPQVGSLVLSVEHHSPALERFGLPQLDDPQSGSRGPLGGLLSALEHLPPGVDWLLLAPCDAPFVPLDLAKRLLGQAVSLVTPGCIVRYAGELQPTFSVWHRSLAARLRTCVIDEGSGGFKQFLASMPLPSLDWEVSEVSPFFNVNTPADLELAERALAH